MAPEITQTIQLLKEVSLFQSLNEAQIENLSGLFSIAHYRPEDTVLLQSQKSPAFFIILDGQVAAERRLSQQDSQVDVYVRGDFFGEDSLIKEAVEPATIYALAPTTVLRLEKQHFLWLVETYPLVKERISRFTQTHRYLSKLQFNWLNEDEVVYQVRRRHPAYLILSLLAPAGILLAGFIVLGTAVRSWDAAGLRNSLLAASAVVLGIGLGWLIWKWIDWTNDLYLVTSQRIVWNEKVVWLYESRIEAPFNTILSINVNTSYAGRILGFGDVIVTTYTGKIVFESIGDPQQLAGLITEYWQRAQQTFLGTDVDEMRHSIKKLLGYQEEMNDPQPEMTVQPGAERADQFQELSAWDKYFGNIFKTRIEADRIITYRKHWLILLRKTLLPGLLGFGLLAFILTFDIMYVLGNVNGEPPIELTIYGMLAILLIILPWWLYHYVDWRNDIYQISDRSIFDIERKPFGSESRKSAPLENILSLEHQRPGFLGYVFNVGSVSVNVGEAKFSFDHVFQPARVQQDIFNRMNALRLGKQKDQMVREREHMLKLIEIYHHESGTSPDSA